jgi:hypothetical protein
MSSKNNSTSLALTLGARRIYTTIMLAVLSTVFSQLLRDPRLNGTTLKFRTVNIVSTYL